jgi:S1-C subfamily serine protease
MISAFTLVALVASQAPLQPGALYAKVAPAVVTVISPRSDGGAEIGSGVVVHKDGWIVTAAHVVEDNERALVKLHEAGEWCRSRAPKTSRC